MKKHFILSLAFLAMSCKNSPQGQSPLQSAVVTPAADSVTPEEADAYISKADKDLRNLWVEQSHAEWDKATNITPETEAIASAASEKTMSHLTSAIKGSMKFDSIMDGLSPDTARQLKLLRLAGMPAPEDAAKTKALAEVTTRMDSLYGKANTAKQKTIART